MPYFNPPPTSASPLLYGRKHKAILQSFYLSILLVCLLYVIDGYTINRSLPLAPLQSILWMVAPAATCRLAMQYFLLNSYAFVIYFWQVGYSGQPLGEDVHFAIVHSTWHISGATALIHVICIHVEANKESESQQDNVPLFSTKIEWLTFCTSGYLFICQQLVM